MKVVAPSNGVFHGRRVLEGIETFRFGYFLPRSLERLTSGGGGIPENMAGSVLARLQVLPMMLAFLVRSLWESRGADLIYANWLGAGIIGALVNIFTGKPLVVSFRGDDGYLARDRWLWRALTLWVTRRASAVAPVSGELVRIIREIGVPESKCKLPRFGVDTELFRPPDRPRQTYGELRVLFVGSLIDRKGVHDLLDALAHPELNHARLVVVGEGPNLEKLTDQAQRLGLTERIDWRGLLPQPEVADLMRSCDVLCLPSYMEGRPNVVNEGMASGMAVVVSRVGGVPDMIDDGRTGLLFDAGDVSGLRQCLLKLATEPGLRAEMGAAARDALERSGISWDATAADFDRIFRTVL